MTTIHAKLELDCPADPSHVVRVGDRLWFVPDIGFVCRDCFVGESDWGSGNVPDWLTPSSSDAFGETAGAHPVSDSPTLTPGAS